MATILPEAMTQFTDALGVPLAGGSVTFYAPNTTTLKSTYQNSTQTILNSNPVILDSAGRAIIFGSGAYRQIVKDVLGNTIWDQTTMEAVVGQASFGGTSTGSANAQIVSAGTFSGTDGSVINFTAGFTNTGSLTIQVGPSGAPIAVLKNGPSGPVNLVSGDIAAGNIYSISYSVSLGTFQLLQSIPPILTIASQAQAQAGTDNTTFMTPLRTNQAFFANVPSVTVDKTVPRFQGTAGVTQTSGVIISDTNVLEAPGGYTKGGTALPFQTAFESAQQTITVGGSLTLAHGLGAQPKSYAAFLLNVTAEGGYSIGNELAINPGINTDTGPGRGVSLVPDATNINVRFGSDGSYCIAILRKDTGATFGINAANWKLIIRAWR